MTLTRLTLVSSAIFLLSLSSAIAQPWVRFADETASRMVAGAFTLLDGEEKDITVVDLDNNGFDDLVIVRKRPFSLPGARSDLLLMNENGVLVDRTATYAPFFATTLTDARDIRADDFDGDGWVDLVIAQTFGGQPKYYRNLGLNHQGAWLGLADESALRIPFLTIPLLPAGPRFCAVWSGDVTGDGAPDLYFANYIGGTTGGQIPPNVFTTDKLLINDGAGVFTDETDVRLGALANVHFGTSAEIHDMNNDGLLDIVKHTTLSFDTPPFFDRGFFVLYNAGNGFFNQWSGMPTVVPYMFTVGDLNGDGLLDLFTEGDQQDGMNIATNIDPNGMVTYQRTPITSLRTAGFGGNVQMVDIDGDGDLDVGVAPVEVDIANCGVPGIQFALLQNPGDGMLVDPWDINDPRNFHIDPWDIVYLDINRDGRLDMFMGLCTGYRVFMQVSVADLTENGIVDSVDLASLLSAWGTTQSGADLNGDGVVNAADLSVLLANWGT